MTPINSHTSLLIATEMDSSKNFPKSPPEHPRHQEFCQIYPQKHNCYLSVDRFLSTYLYLQLRQQIFLLILNIEGNKYKF